MAGPFYVDSVGGGNTDGLSWANAWISPNSLPTLASDEIVYVASNSVDAFAYGASKTITGPTSGAPAKIISVTQGTTTYAAATTSQFNTSNGAYDITFNGAFALYGLRIQSGRDIFLSNDLDEDGSDTNCIFRPAASRTVYIGDASNGDHVSTGGTVDCTADSGGTGNGAIGILSSRAEVRGMIFNNVTNRSGRIVEQGAVHYMSSCNFTGFTNAGVAEIMGQYATAYINNCITAATWAPTQGRPLQQLFEVCVTNTGPADAPTYLYYENYFGTVASSSSIYRSGGATIEGDAVGWLVTTGASAHEGRPFFTPWIYGTTTNGTKTFTLYATCNNSSPTTATLQDDEIWLEVEYLATADEAQWTLVSDQRSTITTAAADQTTESSSTWIGLNDAGQGLADFRFKLECASVSVGESGQYRARVCVGIANVTSSSYLYIDPKITVS